MLLLLCWGGTESDALAGIAVKCFKKSGTARWSWRDGGAKLQRKRSKQEAQERRRTRTLVNAHALLTITKAWVGEACQRPAPCWLC